MSAPVLLAMGATATDTSEPNEIAALAARARGRAVASPVPPGRGGRDVGGARRGCRRRPWRDRERRRRGGLGGDVRVLRFVTARELRRGGGARRSPRRVAGAVRDVASEFGAAEAVDTLFARPLLMYALVAPLGSLLAGVVVGKLVADVVFYALAIPAYELRERRAAMSAQPQQGRDALAPAALDALAYATPFLGPRPPARRRGIRTAARALPGIALHYAVKCNPEPALLARLHGRGAALRDRLARRARSARGARRRPRRVLYSNPVKPAVPRRRRLAAGVTRFAADSRGELEKLAAHAPGAQRLRPPRRAGHDQPGPARRQVRESTLRRRSAAARAASARPRRPRPDVPRRLAGARAGRLHAGRSARPAG